MFDIIQHNEHALRRLQAELTEQRCALIAGAGSSAAAGFPLWRDLIMGLRNLCTDLTLDDGQSLEDQAQCVKDHLTASGKEGKYYSFLHDTFRLGNGSTACKDFHRSLVRLGFCGIATTNYDTVLEEALHTKPVDPYPEPVPINKDLAPSVFEFLRDLGTARALSRVLHLHGVFSHPRDIILTTKDYEKAYAIREEESAGKMTLVYPPHRDALGHILVNHPVFFVGFSFEDRFFKNVIQEVREKYGLHDRPIHFATMCYEDPEDAERTHRDLSEQGITPILYQVIRTPSKADHSLLIPVIEKLGTRLGIRTSGAPVITRPGAGLGL